MVRQITSLKIHHALVEAVRGLDMLVTQRYEMQHPTAGSAKLEVHLSVSAGHLEVLIIGCTFLSVPAVRSSSSQCRQQSLGLLPLLHCLRLGCALITRQGISSLQACCLEGF